LFSGPEPCDRPHAQEAAGADAIEVARVKTLSHGDTARHLSTTRSANVTGPIVDLLSVFFFIYPGNAKLFGMEVEASVRRTLSYWE
jgi:hypothetical protein